MTAAGGAGAARHVLHVFATFDVGGPQRRTVQVLERLPASWRHTLVAMDGRTACAAHLPKDRDVTLRDPPARRSFARNARAMAALWREVQPDLVLTYNWGAIETLLAARFVRGRTQRRPPLVHHEEGFGVEETARFLRRRVWLRRALLPATELVIVPSRTLLDVARRHWRQSAARMRWLPNGVDLRRFVPASAAAGGPPVVGCVAHFRDVKNHALLVRAFARANAAAALGARLVLHGEGPERSTIEALVRELGVAERVTFAGALADTAPAYRGLDVFALASRTEQMPLVVLEAMASGLPIVATDVGDVGRMVAAANLPFLVPTGDEAAFARALDRLLTAPPVERAVIAAANRARCEQEFELEACLRRYVDAYLAALEGPR